MYFKVFVFDLIGSKLNAKSFSYRKKTFRLSILTLHTTAPIWKSRGMFVEKIGIKTGVPVAWENCRRIATHEYSNSKKWRITIQIWPRRVVLLFGRAAREIDLGSDKSSPVFPGSLQLNPLKETNLGVAHAPAQYGCTVSFYRYFFSSRITASDTFKGKTGQRRRRRQLRTAKKHWV